MKMKIRNWPIKVPKTLKKRENFVYYCSLPCFSITRKPWNLKACWHLHLTPLSIIITITQTMNLETQIHKTDWNPQITNHDSFELVQVNIHFLIGLLRWLTAAKNWIIFRFCVFLKSIVNWPSYLNFMYVVGQWGIQVRRSYQHPK